MAPPPPPPSLPPLAPARRTTSAARNAHRPPRVAHPKYRCVSAHASWCAAQTGGTDDTHRVATAGSSTHPSTRTAVTAAVGPVAAAGRDDAARLATAWTAK